MFVIKSRLKFIQPKPVFIMLFMLVKTTNKINVLWNVMCHVDNSYLCLGIKICYVGSSPDLKFKTGLLRSC